MGGQGGCERRIEVSVTIQKENWGGVASGLGRSGLGGRVGGFRVDVNEELKFLGKFTKKNSGGGGGSGGGSGGGGGVGLVGGSGWM